MPLTTSCSLHGNQEDQCSHKDEDLASVPSILRTNQVFFEIQSGRVVPRLREPPRLYGVSGHMSQTVPRWPQECEVIPEEIHHIDWVPLNPELLCEQVNTKNNEEQRKMEVAEGKVVYNTQGEKRNYFLGSCVSGSRQATLSPAAVSLTGPDDTTLMFEARFESGNLLKAVKIGEFDYELSLRTDLYTERHTQWFYFQVRNTRASVRYHFTITNLLKMTSLYELGQLPLLYSEEKAKSQGVGWHRVGQDISYYRNGRQNFNQPCYALSWSLCFPYDRDTCYLAHCYPYTYSNLWTQLSHIEQDPRCSGFYKVRTLCRSLAGNLVPVLTITNPSSAGEKSGALKPAVVLTARIHPGETNSSWVMRGILNFLLGDSTDAATLRDAFVFKLVPMLNPDGVIVGNYRCSLTGRDLNRNYRSILKDSFPTVWATRSMVQRLCEERKVLLYCDLHGHSQKQNVFMYGCENPGPAEKLSHDRVFPLMLSKNSPDMFSFQSCKFKVQRSKEGTGRVTLWRLGVLNSFTLETSFCGSSIDKRKGTHFSTQDLEMMGVHFCGTLLDYCNPDRSKYNVCIRELRDMMRPHDNQSTDQSSVPVDFDNEASTNGSSNSSDSDGPPIQPFTKIRKLKSKRERNLLLRARERQERELKAAPAPLLPPRIEPSKREGRGSIPEPNAADKKLKAPPALPRIEPPKMNGRGSTPKPSTADKKCDYLQRLMEEHAWRRMPSLKTLSGYVWGHSQSHQDANCASSLLQSTLPPSQLGCLSTKPGLPRLAYPTAGDKTLKRLSLVQWRGPQSHSSPAHLQVKCNRGEFLWPDPVREFAVPMATRSARMDWVFLPVCPVFTKLVTGSEDAFQRYSAAAGIERKQRKKRKYLKGPHLENHQCLKTKVLQHKTESKR